MVQFHWSCYFVYVKTDCSPSVCLCRNGSLTVDRLLMIYDMRYLKKMTPLQLSIDPIFLRFIPTFSNRICVVSQVGFTYCRFTTVTRSWDNIKTGSMVCRLININPFKGQRCQLVTLCHPGLTYIFNFWHSGTLALSPERQSARMSEIKTVG